MVVEHFKFATRFSSHYSYNTVRNCDRQLCLRQLLCCIDVIASTLAHEPSSNASTFTSILFSQFFFQDTWYTVNIVGPKTKRMVCPVNMLHASVIWFSRRLVPIGSTTNLRIGVCKNVSQKFEILLQTFFKWIFECILWKFLASLKFENS